MQARHARMAWIELFVGVLPVTIVWLIGVPGMLILLALGQWVSPGRSPVPAIGATPVVLGAASYAVFWLIGGLVGIVSLWSAVLSELRQDRGARRRLAPLVGLVVGCAVAVSVASPWMSGTGGLVFPWWAKAAVLMPVLVALRHVILGVASWTR